MKCPKCNFENPVGSDFCTKCGTRLNRKGPIGTSGPTDEIPVSHTKTLQTPLKELTRGTTFAGRYEIIEELGKGGMGRVYRVVDKQINEEMALKLLKPEIASDKRTIERFRNELKFARKITHKYVCRMHDINEEEGTPYITMEYVPGEDLKSFIRRSRQLTSGTAISIARQVCEGLVEAHQLGLVHRDLKPQNIMIDRKGNAKIMDFGIARSLEAEGVTEAGMIIGTPDYMSPEQAEGEEADERSDIYSFGVILYEMVTGRVPFEGKTPLSIAMKHKGETPKDPKELNAQIPEELNHLILKCMEKDRENRYQSAEDLLSELAKIEEGITLTERVFPKRKPITSKEITVKFGLKKLLIPALVIFTLAIIAVVIWQLLTQKKAVPVPTGKPSIAVLPFADLSQLKDQEYFCDGMTEQLITNLTRIPDLKVIARTSVMQYKNTQKDIRQISQELNVRYILEGSVRKSGNQLRVSAQLIKADEGFHLWADDYDRELKDIFKIQDDVSQSIANTLKVTFSDQTSRALKASYPRNVEAYDCYLKARHYVENTYLSTKEEKDFLHALELAKRAIELDPEFALGYVGIGYLYENRWAVTGEWQNVAQQKEYIVKAYELNPALPETNAAMGIQSIREEDYENAFSYIKSALEINVNNWESHHISGIFSIYVGLYYQVIKSYSKALELNPLNVYSLSNRGSALILVGEFDHALQDIEKAYQIQPDYVANLSSYALALIMKQEYKRAEEILKQAESQPPGSAFFLPLTRALYFAATGKADKAMTINKGGSILAVLGMKDEALDYIDDVTKAETKDYMPFYTYLSLVNLPIYDSLRDEPRFQDIVKREKEKYERRLKKYSLPLND